MSVTLIDFFEHPNKHVGSQRASQVPRVGDEMALIPREGTRASTYRVTRVVWSADLRPAMQAVTGHAVDVYVERV